MNRAGVVEPVDATGARGADRGVMLGVYEKALRWPGALEGLLADAARGGFGFVDLSVDETPERAARLHWSAAQRREVLAASRSTGVAVGGVCLSLHRRIGLGSADTEVRAHAVKVLREGIDLAVDIGAPVLQIAGYYAYYESRDPSARDRYVEALAGGAQYAARRGVLLGIENVDGDDITSISRALQVVREIGSPWLSLYPDIGNLAEQELDVVAELRAGAGHMLALHAKDVRPGEPRRVGMGEGTVPWDEAFTELARQGWSGRLMLEMWNDDAPASLQVASTAARFLRERLNAAGIRVEQS